jgi:hypothetical protein
LQRRNKGIAGGFVDEPFPPAVGSDYAGDLEELFTEAKMHELTCREATANKSGAV